MALLIPPDVQALHHLYGAESKAPRQPIFLANNLASWEKRRIFVYNLYAYNDVSGARFESFWSWTTLQLLAVHVTVVLLTAASLFSNSGAFARQVRDRRWIALALLIPPDVQELLHLYGAESKAPRQPIFLANNLASWEK